MVAGPPNETPLARMPVYWTDGPGIPTRAARLTITRGRLEITQTVLSPYLWLTAPFVLLLGAMAAGWAGALLVAVPSALLAIFGPRRTIAEASVSEVRGAVLHGARGPLSLFVREAVEISLPTQTWRMSASGRSERSAASVVTALARAGVVVADPER